MSSSTDSWIPQIPVGDWVESGIDWLTDNAEPVFDLISEVMGALVESLTSLLNYPPATVAILIFALLGWLLRSWRLGLGTLLGFVLIVGMGMWTPAMETLALVLVATLIAVLIAVPVGILAARSPVVSAIVKPLLDFMQTMPAFVYLIPAVTFFSIGVVPGLFSTIIFALPPGVRLTELGIRQVDRETVEAGHAFGATPRQILRGIQLPLALPTIMAGVNQVIMLALSMAVIAGMVGANGLGEIVVSSIATLDTAKGVSAGLGVVILAIYLDRLTGAFGGGLRPGSLLAAIRNRRRSTGTDTDRPATTEPGIVSGPVSTEKSGSSEPAADRSQRDRQAPV
ncbi:MAG: ABC transporter permease [Actinomycetales bacterium]